LENRMPGYIPAPDLNYTICYNKIEMKIINYSKRTSIIVL